MADSAIVGRWSSLGQVDRSRRPLPPADAASVRALGALVGLAVGSLFSVNSLGSFGSTDAPAALPFPLAVLAAGGVGGWLMAENAWSRRTPDGWAKTILQLGIVALIIGDVVISAIVAGSSLVGPPLDLYGPQLSDPLQLLGAFAGGFLGLALLGLLILGWFVLPLTIGAAAIWSLLMFVIRSLVETTTRPTTEGRLERC
jgi:hypothetical protein